MVDQELFTIFLALTALAVLIQTGILVGFYLLSTKLSRQADQALDMARNLFGPFQSAAESLRNLSAGLVEFSSGEQGRLRRFENWCKRPVA
jgi:hypothetical protein